MSTGTDGVSDDQPVAFWLLPGAADALRLQGCIRDLSREHGTEAFEPHVTLQVASCPRDVDLEAVLGRVAVGFAPLTLGALTTGGSDAYFKALFVGISTDRLDGSRLRPLREQLVRELLRACSEVRDPAAAPCLPAPQEVERALGSYAFLPHLSLLYGELQPPLRTRLAMEHDMQGRSMLFDRIAAVRPAPGHVDLARVAHWEVFGHQRLGGCAAED